MTCKTIEIRDRGTFIPALAVRLDPACERDRWLMARAGFGREPESQGSYVLLFRLEDAPHDPFKHGPARTLRVAHHHVVENFDAIESGVVIDVEYLLGERLTPKESEQGTT